MARRDLRQLGLADSIVRRRGKKSAWLDRLDAALDWPALETIVAGIYASREGGLSYPLLTYVKLLLLQQWYGLSDEGLEAAVDDRLSFRRFAGIPLAESCAGPQLDLALPRAAGAARPGGEAAGRGQPAAGRAGADPAPGHADRRHHPRKPRCGRRAATRVRSRPAIRRPGGRRRTARAGSATRRMLRSTRAAGWCARR